ncbi:MAG: SIMPL domain-containing protein [Acidimicrobiales bacterium]
MTTATIAVKGSASDEVPADYAIIHFGHQFDASARSEALAGGNAAIAHLRETVATLGAGVREVTFQSFHVAETYDQVGPDHIREHTGWAAQVGGQLVVDAGTVPAAVAELIKAGVRTHQLSWHLDPATRLATHRAVRREAVADAKEAANDFALALGAELGSLITLADPGLLGAAHNGSRTLAASATRASATSWDEHVDVDRALITIAANVEASYEVTLP